MSQTSEWNAVMERLEKLERQNRRMKQAGALAMVLAAIVLMGQSLTTRTVEAQTSVQRTVEANEFVLKDRNGQQRARLYSVTVDGQTETGLVLYDDREKPAPR